MTHRAVTVSRRLILGAALFAGVAAACGNDEPPEASTSTTAASGGGGPEPVVCGESFEVVNSDEKLRELEGCEIFEGSLTLTIETTDFSPIASLRVIRGKLGSAGQVDSRTTLAGLEGLESVGMFEFRDHGLHDVDGVGNLREVAGDFRLQGMSFLASLSGLMALEHVAGNVDLIDTPALPQSEIDAFLARIEVGGEVHVE